MSSAYSGTILELRDVGFGYPGGSRLIAGLDLALGAGQLVGLLGANGSGKSTVLRLAAGMLRPSTGEVLLWNKPLDAYAGRDRAKLLCYFPQHLDGTLPFTVREIAAMGLYPYDIPPAMTVEEALEATGLARKAGDLVAHLSGGERRRVFIAMTLLQGAGILLLDEPLANLDIRYQIEFLRLLRRLRDERGLSVLMALHDINLALQFEKVVVLRQGAILGMGGPEAVLTGATLREAFDAEIDVLRTGEGAYIIHEKW